MIARFLFVLAALAAFPIGATLAKYADLLADRPEDRARVRAGQPEVAFLDHDGSPNDAKP